VKSVRLAAWIATNRDDRYLRDVALHLTWALVCVAATAGAVVAIHRAKPRYLGWLIFAMLIGLARIDVSEGAPAQYAATPAMRGGYEAVEALWEFLLVIWALRFGLGAKAKRYFGGPNAIAR
jgi:heme/copper-type cytochrome/quinol oxidase subunit 3